MVCQNPNPTRMQCFCTSHWVAPGLGHKHSPQKASGDPAQKGQNKHFVPTPKVTFICNAVTPWYSGRKEWKMGRSSFIAAKGEVEVLGSACSSVAVAHHSPASLQPHVGSGHGIRGSLRTSDLEPKIILAPKPTNKSLSNSVAKFCQLFTHHTSNKSN